MKRLNGTTYFERDDVGEFKSVDTATFKKACDVFFAKRGMRADDFRQQFHNQAEAAKRRKEIGRALRARRTERESEEEYE